MAPEVLKFWEGRPYGDSLAIEHVLLAEFAADADHNNHTFSTEYPIWNNPQGGDILKFSGFPPAEVIKVIETGTFGYVWLPNASEPLLIVSSSNKENYTVETGQTWVEAAKRNVVTNASQLGNLPFPSKYVQLFLDRFATSSQTVGGPTIIIGLKTQSQTATEYVTAHELMHFWGKDQPATFDEAFADLMALKASGMKGGYLSAADGGKFRIHPDPSNRFDAQTRQSYAGNSLYVEAGNAALWFQEVTKAYGNDELVITLQREIFSKPRTWIEIIDLVRDMAPQSALAAVEEVTSRHT